MAVCNIFKKLTKTTGTFLTFSQYMEDLTASQTGSNTYKIVPSKFVAIDCKAGDSNLDNESFPLLLQEKFENGCACFKNQLNEWNSNDSKILFWDTMFEDVIELEDIKYIGDINLQSYNTVDGMGYSEIYCHIPNEASAYKYNSFEKNRDKEIKSESGELLEGFIKGELNGRERLSKEYNYVLDKNDFGFQYEEKIKLDDKFFNINMIVILYDIKNNNNVVYEGIPMGIYITGLIDNGNIQNSITKYVSNEDIYNSGTSYGLRICSRYVVSSEQDNYIVKDVTCEDNNYGELSRVLSQLSISQNKMDEVINKTYNTEQNYKDLISIFKNSRTNVPYIKVVNNENYWFVNGRMLGPATIEGVYDSYTNTEIDNLLNHNYSQSFQIVATATDKHGNYIFDKTLLRDNESVDIIIKWDVYYEGKQITPSKVTIKGNDVNETILSNKYSNSITIENIPITTIGNQLSYQIEAEFADKSTMTTVNVYFVYPTYFGEISCGNNIEPHAPQVKFEPQSDDIVKLPKCILKSKEQTFEITTDNINPGHICYAYPQNFGKLIKITDINGYTYYELNDITFDDRFTKSKMQIHDVDYYVYIDKTPSYVYKQILKFK